MYAIGKKNKISVYTILKGSLFMGTYRKFRHRTTQEI
jgi:hypothetical protein